ncbi:DEAD-box ATP-dependent RNA helicase 7 [Sarracenia purpurea var. burkii]
MPSIAVPEPKSSPIPNDRKAKKWTVKADLTVESPEFDSPMDKKIKKGKKLEKSVSFSDTEELNLEDLHQSRLEKKKSKKKDKKRKASGIDEDGEEEMSETSSELGVPMNLKAAGGGDSVKKKKKMKLMVVDDEDENEAGKIEDPNAVSNFRISAPLREMLKAKGIESLFPIQAMTFNTILDGSDLVGRARTGQVFADFEFYCGALGLTSCCVYGGAPYQSQQFKLKKGVDIVVGTPGRIKDHIERENIDLSSLKFRVLDEADEMLKMGFVDDVELILGKVEDVSKVQTLLFSATLPSWVKHPCC